MALHNVTHRQGNAHKDKHTTEKTRAHRNCYAHAHKSTTLRSWDRSENNLDRFFSARELLWTLISTTAWNGTLIMNIGPTADGLIPPIFLDRLSRVGDWLRINGQAIYGTRPWTAALPSGMEGSGKPTYAGCANVTFYTRGSENACRYGLGGCGEHSAAGSVFAIFMTYPKADLSTNKRSITLSKPHPNGSHTTAALLVSGGAVPLIWTPLTPGGAGMRIELPPYPESSASAWVIEFTGLKNA